MGGECFLRIAAANASCAFRLRLESTTPVWFLWAASAAWTIEAGSSSSALPPGGQGGVGIGDGGHGGAAGKRSPLRSGQKPPPHPTPSVTAYQRDGILS